ncbi:MAG: bifunctional phosphoglucose/phosphomannose isomerase, partial [Thermoplasmata archaeon]|nr:bifunctional phosphoglucose/phosphomannose isomerase [Thermoplasmata archaeon]
MLDDPDYIKKIDSSGMIELIRRFPQDIKSAVGNARDLDLGLFYPDLAPEKITNVVVSGMGGSGISGEIVRDILSEEIGIPIIVNKSSRLPAFVSNSTLLIVVSYSGNTEETLQVFHEGQKRKVPMVAVTSGGILEDEARKNEVPVIRMPSGYPPRTALPHLLFSVYITLEKAELIEVFDPSRTIKTLRRLSTLLSPNMGVSRNPAKQCALKLRNLLPHIYVWERYGAAADRWRTQLNENSKVMAISGVFSEMSHNDIVGWAGDINHKPAAVLLRAENEPPAILKRMKYTSHLFNKKGRLIEVYAEGETPMEKILSLIYIGDFTSAYLAVLREIDPTPVEIIEDLKRS